MIQDAEILKASPWQMTFGERAALEGILTQLQPGVSIEIGTAEGGSLRRVAVNSGHVHSFDLVKPAPAILELDNVTFHTGDSHALVPQVLAELAERDEMVDFVLVDGDHTPDGVEKDMRDLFASDAIKRTIILAHDTLNDEVREGLGRIDYATEPKVAHVELDFVGGHLSREGPFKNQLWGGIGLFVVDADHSLELAVGAGNDFYDLFELIGAVRASFAAAEPARAAPQVVRESDAEVADLRRRAIAAEHELQSVRRSASWRVTAPLRAVKQATKRHS